MDCYTPVKTGDMVDVRLIQVGEAAWIAGGIVVEKWWKQGGGLGRLWKTRDYCPANVDEAIWMIASASARSLASVERACSMRRMLCMTVV